MKQIRSGRMMVASVMFSIFLVSGMTSWAVDEVFIVMGKVDPGGTLITEAGEVYRLHTDNLGKKVITLSPKIVIVTGRLVEKDGKQAIVVNSYQVVDKPSGQGESDS